MTSFGSEVGFSCPWPLVPTLWQRCRRTNVAGCAAARQLGLQNWSGIKIIRGEKRGIFTSNQAVHVVTAYGQRLVLGKYRGWKKCR